MSKIITSAQIKQLYNISKPSMPIPTHWWKLDEQVAGSVIDYGSSPSNGTNNGAIINQVGFRGKCYEFDGSSYIDGPVLDLFANPWSYSVWVNISSSGNGTITGATADFDCPRIVASTTWLSVYLSSNGTSWGIHGGSQNADKVLAEGQWSHLVLLWTGSYYKIYFNAEEVWSLTSSTAQWSGGTLRLGNHVSYWYNGKMRDFRVYDRALSVRELTDIYRGLE